MSSFVITLEEPVIFGGSLNIVLGSVGGNALQQARELRNNILLLFQVTSNALLFNLQENI